MARSAPTHRRPLIEVFTTATPAVEDFVAALYERLHGQPPGIYTDERTRKSRISVYCENRQVALTLKRRLREGLNSMRALNSAIPARRVSIRRLVPQDWAESWKRHFRPIRIGERLIVRPSWRGGKTRSGQSVVVLDPGLSFGTGHHATTFFCLEQLVKWRDQALHQSFLDLGTGSGILAIAAAKLGYSPVVAFDYDETAVQIAQDNATRNQVDRQIVVRRQDVTCLPMLANRQFDLICANLTLDLLLRERKRIVNRLKATGVLVLAGVLRGQFHRLQVAYLELGFCLIIAQVGQEWKSGAFRRDSGGAR